MNNLPNTNFYYDPARTHEMQGFLDHISTIIRDNPGIIVDKNIVYRELCRWGIKNTDLGPDYQGKNIEPLFDNWENRYRSHRGINVYCAQNWPYFCQFVNNLHSSADGFIKIYVPLDANHVYEGANQIFDFIEKTGIKHQSKIGKHIRSDNVVIRLPIDDIEGAKKIISYISSNPYVREGMNRVNPFLPSINGIGYMTESGISYNSEIAKLIANYLNILKNQGRYFGNIEEFRQFVSQNAEYKEVVDTLNRAIGGEVKKVAKEEVRKSGLNEDQKSNLFMDAMKATLRKYGLEQVKEAVYSAVSTGDYKYFTNGDRDVRYRAALKANVSPTEMGRMIYSMLETTVGRNGISKDLRKNVDNFCYVLFRNAQALVLDEICAVTIENYDVNQVRAALAEFITNGHTDKFSRFVKGGDQRVNYRSMMGKIDRKTVVNLIQCSLALKGKTINSDNIYNLIEAYANTISMGKYAQNNQVEGLSRMAV